MTPKLSEEYGPKLPEILPTCWQKYKEVVEWYPEDLAIVSMHQPAGIYGIDNLDLDDDAYREKPYLRWTYRAFDTAVSRMSTGLHELGAKQGMPMVTFVTNGAERMVACLAANQLGLPFTAVSTRNLINMEETAHMIKLCCTNGTTDGLILVAQDPNLVEQINTLPKADRAIKVLVSGEAPGWTRLETIMESFSKRDSLVNRAASSNGRWEPNDETLFFTSGTTSLPKGCRWAHPQLGSILAAKQSVKSPGHGDRWACVMPNSHGYCHAISIIAISSGTTIVYPSEAFEPRSMFSALLQEKCTHVSVVPTMVVALCAVKEATGRQLPHLKSIMIGGAVVSPQVLKESIEELGSDAVDNAYGMTDGVFLTLGEQRDPSAYIDGDDVAVGKVLPGSAAKICPLDSREPVPRNEVGELHYNGLVNCDEYVGIGKTDDWYVDDQGVRWFKTGDQARMDEQGRIFVIGRYKDIVIRGGKNLACTAMEANLAKNPKLVPFNVQIVAAPDDVAGEVPVAVSEITISPETASEIQETLRKNMGREYIPDEVISAQELGIKAFPRTILGKIKKPQIAKLVKEFRARRDAPVNGHKDSKLATEVREMWAKAVGLPPSRIADDAALTDFADSITVMRVRDRMKRATGRNLSIVEIAEAGTIGNIIALLESRSPEKNETPQTKSVKRQGPPDVDDMVHLVEDPDLLEPTKELIGKTIEPYGLSWQDVQDVFPAYDFTTVMASTGIMDSWNFKFAILPSKSLDKTSVRRAIEAFLKVNPLMPSFLVWNEETLGSDMALHVTLHHSQKLIDSVIEDAGSVRCLDDLKNIAYKYPYPNHAKFPGPLTRFLIYEVKETGSCGFVFNINHGIIDASYGQIMQDDLERAFGSTENPIAAMVQHPDYKLWADSYFTLRSSPEARRAVKWHCNRLKDFKAHKKAMWPKAPTRVPYDDADFSGPDGVQYSFEAPGIRAFRRQHRTVTAPIFVKAALALINIHKTGHTHALFANLEAARTSYPFITKAMAKSGQYEATEVAGPCIESVINLVEVQSDETNAAFLHRMQEDQTNLTKYASAPWREIISALGDAGHMIPDVTQSQIYNWVPDMGTTGTNPFDNFEMLNAVVRPQVGLAFNCGMGGPDGDTIFLHIRGDSLSDEEMLQLAKELEAVTTWMVDKSNWDRPVGGILSAIGAAGEEEK